MKHNFKQKARICAVAVMGISLLASPSTFASEEITIEAEDSNVVTQSVEPRTAKIDWVYKVIGDHLYKRLYNYTTGQWESDWILVQ